MIERMLWQGHLPRPFLPLGWNEKLFVLIYSLRIHCYIENPLLHPEPGSIYFFYFFFLKATEAIAEVENKSPRIETTVHI